jgi:hypothetical protein
MSSKLKPVIAALFAAYALNACSPKSEQKKTHADQSATEQTEPNQAPVETTDANGVEITLADCAGATAYLSGISPIKQNEPKGDTPNENFYWLLLALMDKEPGFEGDAGRLAAESATTAWMDKPEAATRTYIDACKSRYAPK